jgi:hypothetical protein
MFHDSGLVADFFGGPIQVKGHFKWDSSRPFARFVAAFLIRIFRACAGTKIVYNRETLLMLSKSPLSKSPMHLPAIPGITVPRVADPSPAKANGRERAQSGAVRVRSLPYIQWGH